MNLPQLPSGGAIFLDHVGHFVPDVEAASRALARAGFAPTPASIQVNPDPGGGPGQLTGTGNITAMLSRGYIEILFKTADTPLAVQLEAAMRRYCGLHLVAFAVADAAAFQRQLAGQGFHPQPLINMQRPVDVGDGATGTAAFTLARVDPEQMPEGRIQALTHHTPDVVWQSRWLSHPNEALALTRVVMAVPDVEEASRRYARFTSREVRRCARGRTIELDRGRLDLVAPEQFRELLPEIEIPVLPFIGACGIRVGSVAAAREKLRKAGMHSRIHRQTLIARFPEELGHGAWLFTE